jgi:hypothetical protein
MLCRDKQNNKIKKKKYYLIDLFDANECLGEGDGPKAAVKEEEADVGIDTEEFGHVHIVGESGR